jgi:hypothetical protein
MRLQASLAFVLIAVTAAAAQAAPVWPDGIPWVHWSSYHYDTRPKNVALLNDMPCSVLSHPDGWEGLFLTNAAAGEHGFFVDVPDCTAPAGSGWTTPIFYRTRRRLPDVRITLGGLLATPFRVAPRPAAMAATSVLARNDRFRGAAAWQPSVRLDARTRFDRAPGMRPSGMDTPLRRDSFAAAMPATPPRICCVAPRPRAAGTAVPRHPSPKRGG